MGNRLVIEINEGKSEFQDYLDNPRETNLAIVGKLKGISPLYAGLSHKTGIPDGLALQADVYSVEKHIDWKYGWFAFGLGIGLTFSYFIYGASCGW